VIRPRPGLATHGRAGLLLAAFGWPLTRGLSGPRTHFLFFPLWLGYAVVVGTLCAAPRRQRAEKRLASPWAGGQQRAGKQAS
jgi:hypothetical protein